MNIDGILIHTFLGKTSLTSLMLDWPNQKAVRHIFLIISKRRPLREEKVNETKDYNIKFRESLKLEEKEEM